VAIGSGVALFVGACSLVTNLDGLESGDATVDSPADSSAETNGADGTDDAAIDAAGDATVGDSSDFCATHGSHTFCEDFEEPNFQARWNSVQVASDASSMSVVDATSTSPPNSLYIAGTYVASTAMNDEAIITKQFASVSHVTVTADVLIDKPSTCNYMRFIGVYITTPQPPYSAYNLFLQIQSSGGHFTTTTTTDAGLTEQGLAQLNESFSTWATVKLDIDFVQSTAAVTVDGVTSMATTSITTVGTPVDINVKFGSMAYTCGTPSAFAANYDGILIDVK
jgi:hypothetical protein